MPFVAGRARRIRLCWLALACRRAAAVAAPFKVLFIGASYSGVATTLNLLDLAAGLTPYDAASVGSWVHGSAAVLAGGGGPVTPEGVADAVPHVVRDLLV